MKELVKKLVKVETAISKEKGELNLFALFLREDAPNKWDLLIASPWAERNKSEALRVLSGRLQKALTKKDLMKLSRIVIIDQSNPALSAIQRAIHVEHSDAEIKDSNFFGLQIRHAYVITSKGPETA
jgi:hypothetical protein